MPNHKGFAYQHSRLVTGLHQPAATFDRERNGLLAKNMFSCLHGANAPLHVEVVGQRIVNHIDFRILKSSFVGGVGFRQSEFFRGQLGSLRRTGCNTDDLRLLALAHGGNGDCGDESAGPEDCPVRC